MTQSAVEKTLYSMDLDALLTVVFYLLPLIFGFICLYYTFYYLKTARTITDVPTSKIRSAAQGFVVLNGRAQSLIQPTLGQITQKPCAWYYYTIERLTPIQNNEGKTFYNWQILEEDLSTYPFVLKDDTGECVIQPLIAEIIPSGAIVWRGHSRIPNPPSHSFWRQIFWENWGAYRYTERRLELDAPIFAHGYFSTISRDNAIVQENPTLRAYCDEKGLMNVNILSRDNLEKKESLMVSTIPAKGIIQRLNLKSFIFFIGFIFFMTLMVNKTYPVVKKTFQIWKERK